jgi:hypothetical protein
MTFIIYMGIATAVIGWDVLQGRTTWDNPRWGIVAWLLLGGVAYLLEWVDRLRKQVAAVGEVMCDMKEKAERTDDN